jgi:hypothetical protein
VLGGTQVLGIIGAVIVPPWVAGASVLLENLYLRPKLAAERKVIAASVTVGDPPSKPTAQTPQPPSTSQPIQPSRLKP